MTTVPSEHERILSKLDVLLGYFIGARKVADELKRLKARITALEGQGEPANYEPQPEPVGSGMPKPEPPAIRNPVSVDEAAEILKSLESDEPKPAGPRLSDVERERTKHLAELWEKKALDYDAKAAKLRKELAR